ncbi:MAG: CPBP family intramembrane metalloprotease [Gammaproteobacteria bacterium]|nr:CPBP family intramembrane metalloprotease [Gammaproteobacteria bacterium]MYI01645.1 CPBP family intramembrane metalloprotease [Gammaproteobacteria bacterium]
MLKKECELSPITGTTYRAAAKRLAPGHGNRQNHASQTEENIVTVLVSRLVRYRTLRLVVVMWIVTLVLDIFLVVPLIVLFELGMLDESQMGGEFLDSLSPLRLFLVALLFAPVVETWIFQLALLLLAKKLTEWFAKSQSWLPALLITSLAFAGLHAGNAENAWSIYGLLHAVARIPAGFALTLLAIVERVREGGYPVLSVILLHSMYNTVPILFIALPE